MITMEKFKTVIEKVNTMVVEEEFKKRVSNIISDMEQNLENVSYFKGKKEIFLESDNSTLIIDENTIKYRMTNSFGSKKGKYYIDKKTNKIIIKYAEIEKFYGKLSKNENREDITITKEKIEYDSNLNPLRLFKSYDRKEFSIDKNGIKKMLDNFNYPLTNCHITNEYKKLSEDNWLQIEEAKYYREDMKSEEKITYSISNGNGYCVISEDKYRDYIDGKINEKKLFENYSYVKRRGHLVY